MSNISIEHSDKPDRSQICREKAEGPETPGDPGSDKEQGEKQVRWDPRWSERMSLREERALGLGARGERWGGSGGGVKGMLLSTDEWGLSSQV